MANAESVLKREQLKTELEEIRGMSDDGLLHPEKAVLWARQHKKSQLYANLEWNDTAAAEKYRIDQVRQIIRVIVLPSDQTEQLVRAYVSLPSDREHGGGYRTIQDGLTRARQELVNEALKELRNFSNRYTHLPELGPVFKSVEGLVDGFFAEKRQSA